MIRKNIPTEKKEKKQKQEKQRKLRKKRGGDGSEENSIKNEKDNSEFKSNSVETIETDVNIIVDKIKQQTALHIAAKDKNPDEIKALLTKGADVNIKDYEGCTPLHYATMKGCDECIEILLAAPGIDINSKNKHGDTPLHYAAYSQRIIEFVHLLLAAPGIDINSKNDVGDTPLHNSIHIPEYTRILLDTPGIDINIKNEKGNTPLHDAVEYGQTESIKTLLATPGIEINSKNNQGDTPLHIAVSARFNHGETESIETLLAAPGIDINSKNNQGDTPLHVAIKYGKTFNIEKFLAVPGIDINSKNKQGDTPLHVAIEYGKTWDIKTLLDSPGIDINSKNNQGDTPLSIAMAIKNNDKVKNDIVQLLKKIDPAFVNQIVNIETNGTALHQAVIENNINEVQRLLKMGADVNIKDINGKTPLHEASYRGYMECVQRLLASTGIQINIQDNKGNTPLHLALERNNYEIYKLLIDKKATIKIKNEKGETPEYLALSHYDENIRKLLKNKLLGNCENYFLQASGTCYYNSILNGIFTSPRIFNLAKVKFYQYIKSVKKDFADNYIFNKRIHIQLAAKDDDTNFLFNHLITLFKKNIEKTQIDEKKQTLSSEIVFNLYDIQNSENNTTKNQMIEPIILTQQNKNHVAKLLIMKTIYLFMCQFKLLNDNLKFSRDVGKATNKESKSCSIKIYDYIQFLATFTMYINKSFSYNKNSKHKNDYYIDSLQKKQTDVSVYLKEGGTSFAAFKTVLKYIYDYETEYKQKVQIKNITQNPIIDPSCEILILIEPFEQSRALKSIKKITIEQRDMNKIKNKDYKSPKSFILQDIEEYYINQDDKGNKRLKDSVEINGIMYILDHVSINMIFGSDGHSIVGTMCGDPENSYPAVIDSNGRVFPIDWREIPFINQEEVKRIFNSSGYDIENLNISIYITYVCYVRGNLESKYKLDEKEENICLGKTPTTGGGYVSYKGRKYKVRIGKRGGKYILVGKEKNVIYLTEKNVSNKKTATTNKANNIKYKNITDNLQKTENLKRKKNEKESKAKYEQQHRIKKKNRKEEPKRRSEKKNGAL